LTSLEIGGAEWRDPNALAHAILLQGVLPMRCPVDRLSFLDPAGMVKKRIGALVDKTSLSALTCHDWQCGENALMRYW
jgi:hypothetical protein